ncbi:hypothetical protein TanjilG_16890 [Lupinus angustifolius]|nr:hypothetical protein TanjilG_16890 [Lupinus angustifolius]
MWFTSGRRLLSLISVMVLLLILVYCHCCHVQAIRVFPEENAVAKVEFSGHRIIMENNKTEQKEDLFNKYFTGTRNFGPNNRTQKVINETKRRVPSCPDPLHN